MAAFITFQPSDNFKTLSYNGTGSTHGITGVGFAPNLCWIKCVTGGDKTALFTTPTTYNTMLQLSEAATVTTTIALTAFDADGFSVGTRTETNWSGKEYANYNWLAATTTGIDTTGSTITPDSYTLNQTAGISLIKYGGNGSAGALVPHGLAAVPDMFMVKCLSSSEAWRFYHKNLDATAPEDKYLTPNDTDAIADGTVWNDTAPTSVNITIGSNDNVNNSTKDYIAWCFKSKTGYSKFGGYKANGNADGDFVYTGFKPAMLWCKSLNASDWLVFDNNRLGYNPNNNSIVTDASVVQSTTDRLDFLSNGFKLRYSGEPNATSNGYIYAAFAESPFVSSNDIPGVAR